MQKITWNFKGFTTHLKMASFLIWITLLVPFTLILSIIYGNDRVIMSHLITSIALINLLYAVTSFPIFLFISFLKWKEGAKNA